MSIAHMSYVRCDCCGDPGPCGDHAADARRMFAEQGGRRIEGRDICRRCPTHTEPCEPPYVTGNWPAESA